MRNTNTIANANCDSDCHSYSYTNSDCDAEAYSQAASLSRARAIAEALWKLLGKRDESKAPSLVETLANGRQRILSGGDTIR